MAGEIIAAAHVNGHLNESGDFNSMSRRRRNLPYLRGRGRPARLLGRRAAGAVQRHAARPGDIGDRSRPASGTRVQPAHWLSSVNGPLAEVHGVRPDHVVQSGSTCIPESRIAARAGLRNVLEKVTIADWSPRGSHLRSRD